MTTEIAVVSVPRPGRARLAVAIIFCLNGLALANWIARIPDVKQQLALSDQLLGLVLLCVAAGALVAQPTVGWLIGRVGSRRMTTVMLIGFCLSVMLPGLAASMVALMGVLFIFGACNGGLDVAMNAQAALVEQRYARPIMSSFHGLWSIGGLAGAALGGLIATQGVTVRTHLLGVAIVATIIAVVATRWLVVDDQQHHEAGPSVALPPRALVLLGLIAFGVLFCEGAVADWSAVYLRGPAQHPRSRGHRLCGLFAADGGWPADGRCAGAAAGAGLGGARRRGAGGAGDRAGDYQQHAGDRDRRFRLGGRGAGVQLPADP